MCLWSVHMLVTAAAVQSKTFFAVVLFFPCCSSCGIFMVDTVHSSYFTSSKKKRKENRCVSFLLLRPHGRNEFEKLYKCSGVCMYHLLLYLRHVMCIFFSLSFFHFFFCSFSLWFFIFSPPSFAFVASYESQRRSSSLWDGVVITVLSSFFDAFALIVSTHTHSLTQTYTHDSHTWADMPCGATQHTTNTPSGHLRLVGRATVRESLWILRVLHFFVICVFLSAFHFSFALELRFLPQCKCRAVETAFRWCRTDYGEQQCVLKCVVSMFLLKDFPLHSMPYHLCMVALVQQHILCSSVFWNGSFHSRHY